MNVKTGVEAHITGVMTKDGVLTTLDKSLDGHFIFAVTTWWKDETLNATCVTFGDLYPNVLECILKHMSNQFGEKALNDAYDKAMNERKTADGGLTDA